MTIDLEELKKRLRKTPEDINKFFTICDEAADALSQLQVENAELRRELEEARKDQARYKWLAPKILAPDYGDNDLPGEQIGWRIDNHHAGTRGVRNQVFIAGPSIDAAIDAARQQQG